MRLGRLERRFIRPVYLLALFALVVAIALLLRDEAFVTFTIEHRSMQPTLQPGEQVLAYSVSFWGAEPEAGDLVTFIPPDPFPSPTPVVKRVVAVAGDAIEILGGLLFVGGRQPTGFGAGGFPPGWRLDRRVVPPGTVFVLGDNRRLSEDSTSYGPISVKRISDIVWLKVLPWSKRCSFGMRPPGFPRCPGETGAPDVGSSAAWGSVPR